ncbi:GntR family transcriptional regulator [Pseudonocardia humida]|uniref:Winged helix-turn-helix transcriptional regulator n=1 Tax=Pseudonocardia humida TaxID=2800819 RepID=A0ABT1A8C6_9PSEU|nr:winged helix-turn-helix domain-containing protein [Pseudonocardia humida]MCO1659216.1 winged helix-turn-helix transcriptional regulator [Pseudonocardia humida]
MAVRFDDSRPTYLQVADVLRAEIKAGRPPAGERLSSVRDLTARFDVSAATVQSALRVLRESGVIAARSTRGYFVSDEPPTDHSSADAPSAEFVLIREQLHAVQGAVRDLGDRISRLEAAMLPRETSPGAPSESP